MGTREIATPFGPKTTVTEVGIVKRDEPGILLELDDGSTIRVLNPIGQVVRIEGQWDNFGNPLYMINQGCMILTMAADELRRRPPEGEKGQ